MNKRPSYDNFYSWETALSNEVVGHNNGAVSLMMHIDGLYCEMDDPDEKFNKYQDIYKFISSLDDCVAEFHLWRERDDSLAQSYVDDNEKIERGGHLAIPIRNALAGHLAQYGWNNECAIVLYKKSNQGLMPKLLNKSFLKAQINNAEKLYERAKTLTRIVGGNILSVEQYFDRVMQSMWRKGFKRGYGYNLDFKEDLSSQAIYQAPKIKNSMVEIDGEHTKVLLLYHYPDADPAWFLNLASISCEMHVSQIIVPTNTRRRVDKHSDQTDKESHETAKKGAKYRQRAIIDRELFTNYVTQNNLSIFNNAYLIHLHGDSEQIKQMDHQISDWAYDNGGLVKSHYDLQAHFFRAAQPGHGTATAFLREDHTWQVAHMAPVTVFDKGTKGGESLRVTTSGQLVGFSILQHKVSNGFTVAHMGAGKGVDKGTEVIETYPYGLDWYIMEIGETYRWIVEGFGGNYTRIDPDHHAVNPLPEYDLSSPEAENPLNMLLCSGTVNSLAFLLTDGRTDLTIHETAAAELALQNLYSGKQEGTAPKMPEYLESIEQSEYPTEEQKRAADSISSNLRSFLSSSIGQIFKKDDNLTISDNICGIDLKLVKQTSAKLLKFYLVFISLKYSQKAFFKSDKPARVLLDELHIFIDSAPDETGRLVKELTRMGRKDFASSDLVTQGLYELKTLDNEVVTGATLRSLLYRKENHREMGEILEIPETPLAKWQAYPSTDNIDWRPGLRFVHDKYYDLYLTFPEVILDITSTQAKDMALKEQIQKKTPDVFERVKELRRLRFSN